MDPNFPELKANSTYWKRSPESDQFKRGKHLLFNPNCLDCVNAPIIHGVKEEDIVIAVTNDEVGYRIQSSFPNSTVIVVGKFDDIESEFKRDLSSALIYWPNTIDNEFFRLIPRFISVSMKRDSYLGLVIPSGDSEDSNIFRDLEIIRASSNFLLSVPDEISDTELRNGFEIHFPGVCDEPANEKALKEQIKYIRKKSDMYKKNKIWLDSENELMCFMFQKAYETYGFVAESEFIVRDVDIATNPKMTESQLYAYSVSRPISRQKQKDTLALFANTKRVYSGKPKESDK